jgi:hypothetical protein
MNIEQQIKCLQTQLDALREQCKQQPEFEYPIYMQAFDSKGVVKFTSLNCGTVVVQGKCASNSPVGQVIQIPSLPHTNTDYWKPITFNEKLGIADKQLCECWDGIHTHTRNLRFYDAVNRQTFTIKGKRKGSLFDYYRPIPYADYPDWAIEAEKTLED